MLSFGQMTLLATWAIDYVHVLITHQSWCVRLPDRTLLLLLLLGNVIAVRQGDRFLIRRRCLTAWIVAVRWFPQMKVAGMVVECVLHVHCAGAHVVDTAANVAANDQIHVIRSHLPPRQSHARLSVGMHSPDAAHVPLVGLVQLPRQSHLDLALSQLLDAQPEQQHDQHDDKHQHVQSHRIVDGRTGRRRVIDVELVDGEIVPGWTASRTDAAVSAVCVRIGVRVRVRVAVAVAVDGIAGDAGFDQRIIQADEIAAGLTLRRLAAIVRRRTQNGLAGARRSAVVANAQTAQIRSGYVEAVLFVQFAVHVDAIVFGMSDQTGCMYQQGETVIEIGMIFVLVVRIGWSG